MKGIAVSLAMVAFAAGAASAQVPAQRVKNVAIEAEELKGELPRPMLDRGTGRGPAAHDALISPRADFVREIVKSAEGL